MENINYYLGLPYTEVLRRDEEGDFVAKIDELPGCIAHGKNKHEALERLEEAKALWITDCIESGDPVPEPVVEEGLPSGKWVQRVPRSLHRKLVLLAKREKVSLNQLVTSLLSEAVGMRKAEGRAAIEGKVAGEVSSPWKLFFEATGEESGEWSIFQHPGEAHVSFLNALRLLNPKIQKRMTFKFEEGAKGAYEEEEAYQVGGQPVRAVRS